MNDDNIIDSPEDPVFSVPALAYFIVALAAGLYLCGIVWAGVVTISASFCGGSCSIQDASAAMPSFLSLVITSIGGVLATCLGGLLGINIRVPEFNFLGKPKRTKNKKVRSNADYNLEWFQKLAAWGYCIGLVVALLIWAITGFEDETKKVAPVIMEMSKTLLGVMVGVLAVALGVET